MSDGTEWLVALEKQIRRYMPSHWTARFQTGHFESIRDVTEDEWTEVQRIVKSERLLVEPCNSGMGFNFGITIFETPLFPGLPCTALLHLEGGDFDMRFEAAWEKLSPLSHNDDNAAMLQLFQFKKLEDKHHYAY